MLRSDSLNDPELVSLLKAGSVGVLPTDTVYGLACLASDKAAVKRLYELKSREHKPGTIIAADVDQLESLGIKYRYLKAVEQYWPGPVSVIVPCGKELEYLHLGKYGLAVRLTIDGPLRTLLSRAGPFLTTSANHPGKPVAATIKAAERYFNGLVDFYIDGGDLTDRSSSTLIRIVDDAVEVIRQGAVTIDPETGELKR